MMGGGGACAVQERTIAPCNLGACAVQRGYKIYRLSRLPYRQAEMECGASTRNTTAFNPDIPIHRLNQATRNI